MVPTMRKSCKRIEEQSRYTWRVLSSDPVECISAPSFYIYVITKFVVAMVSLPYGEGNCITNYKKARESIADPIFTNTLEKEKVYNWTRCTKMVVAVFVPGDGNSLCHAVAVHICGITDQVLFFRRCLRDTLEKQEENSSPLCVRWKSYTRRLCEGLGRSFSEESLTRLWTRIVKDASISPVQLRSMTQNQTTYAALSQFHIFVMAQICRRPVVVVGLEHKDFKPSVYLPVLIPIEECIKYPIYLAYNDGHFAPLIFVNEVSTEIRFKDLCIPLTDKEFNHFEFPYLLEQENGLDLLKKYAKRTEIVYTTDRDISEVPAIRVPDEELPDFADSGINPSSFFKTCFSQLTRGGSPLDVFSLWKFVIELQSKFEEQLPVGFTFDSGIQPVSTSYQPESENEEETAQEQNSNSQNLPSANQTAGPSNVPTQQSRLRNEGSIKNIQTRGSDEDVYEGVESFTNNNADASTTVENQYNMTGDGTSSLLNASAEQSLEAPMSVQSRDGHDYNENDENRIDEDDRSYFSTPRVALEEQEDAAGASNEGLNPPPTMSLPSGVVIIRQSSNHIIVSNCKNIVFTVLKIKSDDEQKEVELRFQKSGLRDVDKVKLVFRADNDLDVEFTHVLDDKLEVRLTKLRDNLYRLSIRLPNTVISEVSRPEQDLSEAMAPTNDGTDTNYVTLEDHPSKCRTAGCNGRAVALYRNLCGSCYEAWTEMLNRTAENSASFSYFDSVASSNDGQCSNPECNNPSSEGCYGFCETCYRTPAL